MVSEKATNESGTATIQAVDPSIQSQIDELRKELESVRNYLDKLKEELEALEMALVQAGVVEKR